MASEVSKIGMKNVYYCAKCEAHQVVIGPERSVSTHEKEEKALQDAKVQAVWKNHQVKFVFNGHSYTPLENQSTRLTFYTDGQVTIGAQKLYSSRHEFCKDAIACGEKSDSAEPVAQEA